MENYINGFIDNKNSHEDRKVKNEIKWPSSHYKILKMIYKHIASNHEAENKINIIVLDDN